MLRPYIDPPLNAAGKMVANVGLSANAITLLGLLSGLIAAYLVSIQWHELGLLFIAISRIFDGLDGAVARATQKSDFGGYLDIVCDFIFYVSIPLGFAISDPANVLAALVLIASFTITGISFLAYAVIAAERGAQTSAHGEKSFFYSTGIAEGTETIAFFVIFCAFPGHFQILALVFAGLCFITVMQRSYDAWKTFRY